MTRPIFGGWTPTYEGDMCQGGHPPQSITDNECGRCGRKVDPAPCLCGDPTHRGQLSRSMCPTRMRFDKRDAEEHMGITTTEEVVGTDPNDEWAEKFARQYWMHGNDPKTQAALHLLALRPSVETVERWSRHLLHTSMHNTVVIGIGGRLQRQANEIRGAVGLKSFGWGDAILDAEFEECTVHVSNYCKGQETH